MPDCPAWRQHTGMPGSRDPKPIEFRGHVFPHRKALAEHLAPILGRTVTTLAPLLSRYAGDVERVINPRRLRRLIKFKGVVFPHRKALAEHLAPILGRPTHSIDRLLRNHGNDVKAVFAAKPYRSRAEGAAAKQVRIEAAKRATAERKRQAARRDARRPLIVSMRARGLSWRAVGAELGISAMTAFRLSQPSVAPAPTSQPTPENKPCHATE